MSDLREGYDELPYASEPQYATHPDRLATPAVLRGLYPAPVAGCRVLELGCADGGNLLAMAAALPGSRFVGIDLSPRQIARGSSALEALGLDNARLEVRDLAAPTDDLGEFDYIVCHGVYSWVADEVRERILAICSEQLAVNGVAYVGYNTYPGWHRLEPLRELLRHHVRRAGRPRAQVAAARAFLDFYAHTLPAGDPAHAQIDELRADSDAYLFHEYLEGDNHPVRFADFMAHAGAHGLQYLDDAAGRTARGELPVEVWNLQDSNRGVDFEQYLDHYRHRTFRRSLLCHAHLALLPTPSPGVVGELSASAAVRPLSARVDIRGGTMERFEGPSAGVASDQPLVKATLAALDELRPRALSLDALVAEVAERLGETPRPALMAGLVLEAHYGNIVGLHAAPPPLPSEIPARPVGARFARWQAERTRKLTNLWHGIVEPSELDLAVLRLLDGTRDRAAIAHALGRLDIEASLGRLRDLALLA